MCEVRTTDGLYSSKVKRAGSVHELGEVKEELRLAAAGMECPAEPGVVAANQAGHHEAMPSCCGSPPVVCEWHQGGPVCYTRIRVVGQHRH